MLGFAGLFFIQEDDEQTRGFLFELKMRGLRLKKEKPWQTPRFSVKANSQISAC